MHKCILCRINVLPSKKPEHILLNAMGGRKTTKNAICSSCNSRLGSGPDVALADTAVVIRNHLNFYSGDGKPPPTIRNIKGGGENYNLKPGGVPEHSKGKKALRFNEYNDRVEIDIRARDTWHLKRLLKNVAVKFNIPMDEVEKMIVEGKIIRRVGPTPEMGLNFELGGTDAIRSMAKSCLVLWSLKAGGDEVHDSRYDRIRNFILNESDKFTCKLFEEDVRPINQSAGYQEEFGADHNVIYVVSNSKGRTLGYFLFYGVMAWVVELCREGAPPNLSIGLASNPADPSIWSDKIAETHPIPFDWIASPSNKDLSLHLKKALRGIFSRYFQMAEENEIGRITDEVFRDHGFPDEVSSADRFITDIAERVTHFIMRTNHERLLIRQELRRLLYEEKDD